MLYVQLAHGGRKAGMQRPWRGNGPLDDQDLARGDMPWQPVGPSARPVGEGWAMPHALSKAEIANIVDAFAAAGRALAAGFEVALAEQVRREAGIMTQAVGPVTLAVQAEAILQAGQADLIAIGREALADPTWSLSAAVALGYDSDMALRPEPYGWWLVRRPGSSEFHQPGAAARSPNRPASLANHHRQPGCAEASDGCAVSGYVGTVQMTGSTY